MVYFDRAPSLVVLGDWHLATDELFFPPSRPHHTHLARGGHTSINTRDTEALFWRVNGVHRFIHPLQNHEMRQIKALKWRRHFSPNGSMKARVNNPSCYCPEQVAIIFSGSCHKSCRWDRDFPGGRRSARSPWREVASVQQAPTEQLKGNRFTHGHGHEDSKPKISDQKKTEAKVLVLHGTCKTRRSKASSSVMQSSTMGGLDWTAAVVTGASKKAPQVQPNSCIKCKNKAFIVITVDLNES